MPTGLPGKHSNQSLWAIFGMKKKFVPGDMEFLSQPNHQKADGYFKNLKAKVLEIGG